MSQSPKEAAAKLALALEYGRCPICDGIKCDGLEESCTCCERCGNFKNRCVCCIHCWNDLQTCTCSARIADIWNRFYYCGCAVDDTTRQEGGDAFEDSLHEKGVQCPNCCAYCKELTPACKCCKKCGTTPCICCTTCGELRIKCKCWSAKVLLHFMRRAVHYHKMQQQLHVCPCPNTRFLLMVRDDYT
jgi:hypothetical protein